MTKKKILLVEDDGRVMDHLEVVFQKYETAVELLKFQDAGALIDYLQSEPIPLWPDAILLDLMMPYRNACSLLDPNCSDPDENDTGIRLIDWFRREEKEKGLGLSWVAIITARSPFAIEPRILELLSGHGKVYYKPFNTIVLEDDLMKAIEVPSQVHESLLVSNSVGKYDDLDIDEEENQ